MDRVEGEEGLERVEVDLAREVGQRPQRLQLGGEREVGPVAVVERLDPEAVAREHEPAPLRVPHRDREHAPQPLGEARPVLLVEVDEHLGVGVRRAEAVAGRLELRPQLGVVVDLAVLDDDDPPVLVGDRLVAALEVDDRQPPRRQPGLAEHDLARAVRPAVAQRFAHGAQQRGVDGAPVAPDDAADPAHRRFRGGHVPPGTRGTWRCDLRTGAAAAVVAADDLEVQAHAAVGDVLEVVGELLGPGHVARQPQLREAGDARAHDQPLPVAGDVARQLLEEARPDRARADDAHLAAQHVPELRQLVELGGAQDVPDARLLVRRHARQLDAGVAPDARLRLRLERAELEHGEDRAAAADAGAVVEDAAGPGAQQRERAQQPAAASRPRARRRRAPRRARAGRRRPPSARTSSTSAHSARRAARARAACASSVTPPRPGSSR